MQSISAPPPPPIMWRQWIDIPIEDLHALAAAAIFIIFALAVIWLRTRFAVVEVDRKRLRGPGKRAATGPCRWAAKSDQDDGAFRAWRCQRCGAMRWTASRSDPPAPCR